MLANPGLAIIYSRDHIGTSHRGLQDVIFNLGVEIVECKARCRNLGIRGFLMIKVGITIQLKFRFLQSRRWDELYARCFVPKSA